VFDDIIMKIGQYFLQLENNEELPGALRAYSWNSIQNVLQFWNIPSFCEAYIDDDERRMESACQLCRNCDGNFHFIGGEIYSWV
jgi:hypothetical protein